MNPYESYMTWQKADKVTSVVQGVRFESVEPGELLACVEGKLPLVQITELQELGVIVQEMPQHTNLVIKQHQQALKPWMLQLVCVVTGAVLLGFAWRKV